MVQSTHLTLILLCSQLGVFVCVDNTQQLAAASVTPTPLPQTSIHQAAVLNGISNEIRNGEFGNTHALLVAHKGQLMYEAYFTGDERNWGEDWTRGVVFNSNRLHDGRSITKSIVSVLVGIALYEGHIASLDAPLRELLPSHHHLLKGPKANLTLRHLLTMTAGFKWNEDIPTAENDESRMYASTDPLVYVLEREITSEPGKRWTYSGGTTHVLGVILEQSTGQPLEEYARKVLFQPLSIQQYEWRGDFAGIPAAASGLRFLPRDFLKLGIVFANRGRWNGRQIIPAAWLEQAMGPQIEIPVTADAPAGAQRSAYGFQWWYDEYQTAAGLVKVSTASGLGGQRIFVIPDRELVVVVLSGHFGRQGSTWIPEQIMHRVLESKP